MPVEMRDPINIGSETPTPAPDEGTSLSDYGNAALGTVGDLAAGAMAGSRYSSEKFGDPDEAEVAGIYQKRAREFAQGRRDAMSDSGKKAINSSVLDSSFWEHPFRAVALKGTSMAPFMVAAALPGGIVGEAFGAAAGAAATVGVNAALSADSFIDSVDKKLDEASDKTLVEQSDYYAGLRARMSEKEARSEFKDYMLNGNGRLALNALVGGVAALGGPAGMAGRAATGGSAVIGAAEKSALATAGIGALEGAATMGVQGGVASATEQYAGIKGGFQKDFDWHQWTSQTLEGMGLGGLLSGAIGALTAKGGKGEKPKADPKADVTDEQRAALEASQTGKAIPDQTAPPAGEEAAAPPTAPAAPPVEAAAPPTTAPTAPVDPVKAATAGLDETAARQQERATPAAPVEATPVEAAVEVPPAESPPAPVKDQGKQVPETKAQFAAQVAELVDPENPRSVVLFPKGTKAADKPPMPEGMKATSTKDGTFYYDPKRTSPKEIFAASKEGRLNDTLSMGKTTKTEAIADAAKGAEPLTVVKRNEEGVATVEHGTTDKTVAQDIAAVKENAVPGDTVEVSTPAAVKAEREAAPIENLDGKRVIRTEDPALTKLKQETQARLDKADKEAAKGNRGDFTDEQQMKDAKARQKFDRDVKVELKKGDEAADWAKEAAAIPKPGSGKPYTADNLAKLQAAHRKQLAAIEERRAAMPEKTKEVVQKAARKGKKDETRKLSPEMEKELAGVPEADRPKDFDALLAMAKREKASRLARKAVDELIEGLPKKEQQRLSKLTPEQREEFANLLRSQKVDERGEARGVDKEGKGSVGEEGERDLEVRPDVEDGTNAPEHGPEPQEKEDRGVFTRRAREREDLEETRLEAKASDKVLTAEEARAEDVARRAEEMAKKTGGADAPREADVVGYAAREAKTEAPSYAAMRPKVEGKISLSRRLKQAVEKGEMTLEQALGLEDTQHPLPHEVKSTTTLNDGLSVARGLDQFGDVNRGIVMRVMQRLKQAVGDTEVVVVSQKTMDRLNPGAKAGSVHAYFEPAKNHIVVSDRFVKSGKIDASVLTHEGVHALLDKGLARDHALRKLVDELRDHVKDIQGGEHYGFKDAHEFLAEALSNPEFQDLLMSTPIPRSMAERLGMNQRTSTMWDGLLQGVHAYMQKVYKLFGGERRSEQFNALSAVMRLAERADRGGPDGMGERRARSDYFDKLKEKFDTTNGRGIIRAIQRATDSMTMLSQRAERLGGKFGEQARFVSELNQRADVAKNRHLERAGGGVEVVREGSALARSNPEAFAKLTDVMFKASEANVNLAKNGVVPDNAHLGKDAMRGWQGKARLDGLLNDFRSLPEDMQDWALKAVKFGSEERSLQAMASIKAILKAAGIEEPGLAERIHTNGVTDADRAKFKTDKIVEHLDKVSDLKKREGWYVPFLRDGDHIAAGRVSVDVAENAFTRKVSDNVVQFNDPKGGSSNDGARKAAEDFVSSHALSHVDTEKVWVDKNDHSKVLEAEDPNAVPAYRVTMQDKIFELHKSEKEALAASERMKSEGALDVYTDLLRQNPDGQWGGVMPSQYETVINSLTNRDHFKTLPKADQDALVQAMHEANIKLLPGGRIQKTSLQRRNVMGYSKDIVNSMGRYADMSAGYLAKLEYQPKIRQALKEMGDFIDQNRDGMTVRRREILREMESRIYQGAQSQPNNGTFGGVLSRLLQVSSIDKLAGVSFHVINATEPSVISVPIIGGRHGFGAAAAAMSRAYDLVGGLGALKSGVRDTVRAAKQSSGFTDYLDMFKHNIASEVSPEHAKRLNEMLDHLSDRNLFGTEAGMEIKRLSEPTGNFAGRTLDKIDLMSRQMGTAIEAINRSVTAITAYNLEFKRNGGNHEAAMRYAHDIVHDTMGNYASSNAAPIFNTPVGRAALQFKKYGQKIYYLLGKTIGGSMRGDPEAMKQFAGFMFTHGVVAGVLGWPLEPIKVGMMAANAMGATNATYDDFEQVIRSTVAGVVGQTAGEAITRGVPRLAGVDLSGRMGLENLLTFGQPRSQKQQDLKAWLFDTVAGAPAGFVLQELAGAQELMGGNLATAADKMIPLKAARDINRAITGFENPKLNKSGREVMSPYSTGEAITRGLGFTPAREAESREQRSAVGGDVQQYSQNRKALMDNWLKADPANRGKQMIAIEKFNRGLPKDAQISSKDLHAAEKRRKTESADGTVENGIRFTKRTEHLRSGMDTYNVGQ